MIVLDISAEEWESLLKALEEVVDYSDCPDSAETVRGVWAQLEDTDYQTIIFEEDADE